MFHTAIPHIFLLTALVCATTAMTAVAADLTVVVAGLENDEGSVRVGLFHDPNSFPKSFAVGKAIEAKAGSVNVTFDNLSPGNYAVSAYQDINSNKKLDTNFVGKPTEPNGFSQDARGIFGPPSFADAQIVLADTDQNITIQVK
jgi:uncharacterized protein (DUF2141 family)